MQRFKNWLITALLKKDKLVAVPQAWQTEYVKLAGDKVRNQDIIAKLITEYNDLLKDYFEACSAKELQSMCIDGDIKVKAGTPKAQLVEILYNEFRMTIESD